MDDRYKHSLRKLWASYKLYWIVSANQGEQGSSEYATKCTDQFIEYCNTMAETYPSWKDTVCAINNQVRILNGLIEIYDRPAVREKITQKTRWSL